MVLYFLRSGKDTPCITMPYEQSIINVAYPRFPCVEEEDVYTFEAVLGNTTVRIGRFKDIEQREAAHSLMKEWAEAYKNGVKVCPVDCDNIAINALYTIKK